ncbi:MAG TPA: methionyl-tRNA formyltransferase [Ideonella sp.]|uniref:methionyl-tRNA formyltransferase n=1 Tax=Ideonella sp. TaxID=1929293 RepID=UPI002BB879AD|nr:methionyl-tRNA formyltransferase [Ideonella sp.]HSI50087.1 methionyl-tRNA formyltransferase [Ideonella sp.]
MKLVFAGTPEFAAVALQALLAAGFEVPLVLSQPDRPAGRGMKLQASPVKALALQHGLAVSQPRSLRLDGKYPEDAAAAREALLAAAPDVMIVAAYGLILPAWVLALPRLGCLNIHASLLPRWRGAAPIHRAIEAGDARTGITIMQMDAGLDTGDMLLIGEQPIQPDDRTATLHDRLAVQGGKLIVQALQTLQRGQPLPATQQPADGITYAHKIDKAEGSIDWRSPAALIERRMRAFDPFPGASFAWDDEVVKLWQAELRPASAGAAPGQVLAASGDELVVACGDGALALQQVQRPGGKRVPVSALLQVRPGQVGQTLSLPGKL